MTDLGVNVRAAEFVPMGKGRLHSAWLRLRPDVLLAITSAVALGLATRRRPTFLHVDELHRTTRSEDDHVTNLADRSVCGTCQAK